MRKILITWLVMLWLTMWYSYAWLQEFDLWYAEEITANSNLWHTLELESNANFILDDEYRIIKFAWEWSYPSTRTYFWNWNWTTWSMYVTQSCNWWYNCNWSIIHQWYIKYVNIVDLSTIDYTNWPWMWLTPIEDYIWNTIYSNPDKLLIWWNGNLQTSNVCFGYTELNKAVCFVINYALVDNCNSYPQYCDYLQNNAWVTSQELDYLKEYGTMSPFTQNTPSWKPDTEWVCMTIQDMLDRQNGTYNTWMCYSNTRYLTSTWRVTNTPKFITELYPTYTELRQDMNLYTNYCTPPADMNYCQQAFSWKEDNYTLIQKIPATTDLTVLYDFCTTYQTRSWDLQKNVCDMTEEERKNLRPSQMTQEWYAERIAKHPTTTTTPTTWTVYDELTDQQDRDLLEAIPRVYTKITWIFKARSWVNGIIPDYITWLLLLIVLFSLFKK